MRTRRAGGTIVEPDDGTAGGYGWRDLAAIAEARLGRKVRLVAVPRAAAGAGRHGWPSSTADAPAGHRSCRAARSAELYHRDWVSDTRAMAAVAGWQPRIGFGDGLVGHAGLVPRGGLALSGRGAG